MFTCYLAGFMSGDKLKETTEWRYKIRSYFKSKDWPIVWSDPYNGKDIGSITKDGLKSSVPPHAIVHRDYMCVEKANLIVANLDTFGSTRPLTGTICELAWAWKLHKPIIIISNDPNYKEHPFINYFSSWILPDVETLLKEKVIEYFYQGTVSAKYTI